MRWGTVGNLQRVDNPLLCVPTGRRLPIGTQDAVLPPVENQFTPS
jgi:hypothetical protein